jgi:hypothetical protein
MMELEKSEATLERLARAARRTGYRLRLDETLARAALLLPLVLVYAIATLTYIKVARPAGDLTRTLLWLGAVPVLLLLGALLRVWFRPRAREQGALALDRHHGLADRITNALAFLRVPAEQRSPLMQLAIADAAARVPALAPRAAAPIHFPRELGVVALLGAGLFVLANLEVRTLRTVTEARRFEPMVMSGDDLDLFRELTEELAQKSQDPEALAAVARFNQLIEDIAQRRLDRREVFERMERLERELTRASQADREALEEGIKNVAQELAKSDLSKPVAEHLKEQRLADAEKALRELAEKLRNKQQAPSKAELEKLRTALARASRTNTDKQRSIEQRRQELEKQRQSLLKKSGDAGMNARDKSLLKNKERQLERLEREKQQAQRAERQLSKLDRELAKAAEDLMRELGASAQDLERGAEDLNRMAKQEMTEQEKEQLRKRLQELRELVRQQGQGGKQRLQRLMRFAERARGNEGQGQQRGQGQKPGSGKRPGQGAQGTLFKEGQGGKDLMITQGGPGGQQAGASAGSGTSGGKPGQDPQGGGEASGQGAGSGHDPKLAGDPSKLEGATQDVTAVAADTGQGTASSEVIHTAAQRGFVGRGYRKVYTDYKNVAEQVMNEDQIPPGYRFYVQRYFQLIRPRE